MKIEIELTEESGWKVTYEDKYADNLDYHEMIGLVTSITFPKNRPSLHWLKTEEEHKIWLNSLTKP